MALKDFFSKKEGSNDKSSGYQPPNTSGGKATSDTASDVSTQVLSAYLRTSLTKKQELSTVGSFNFRVLAFAAGVAMLVTSAMSFILFPIYLIKFELFNIFLSVYGIIFGCLMCIFEGTFLPRHEMIISTKEKTIKFLPFLNYLWGRGVLYAFSGTLQLAQMSPMHVFSGVCCIGVGVIFVAVGFDTYQRLSKLKKSLTDQKVLKREFERFDRNSDGILNRAEFSELIINLTGDSEGINEDEIEAAFCTIDADDSDGINLEELKKWWQQFDTQVEGMDAIV